MRRRVITMTESIHISIVSYLNSKPFLYGLKQSKLFQKGIVLSLDSPAVCAQKLIQEKVDLGLVPVAIIPLLKEHYIISDYCIGASGKVGSVMLYSEVSLHKIKKVLLDYQSKTSVNLVKVLAKHLWKISPVWENATEQFEAKIENTTAAVIIGDRTFGIENKYAYSFDLSEEWEKLTGLPFVFACWVANKKLPDEFISEFNQALKYGVDNRFQLIRELTEENQYATDIADYLNHKIDYNLNADKKKAMALFLNYLKEL
jgi:chorismate dehydratase